MSRPTASAVLARAMTTCLDQLEPNRVLYLASGHPEALHKTRVAVRRLRSVFSLGSAALAGDDEAARLKAAIRAAALPLGEARDLDVLLYDPLSAPDHPARPALRLWASAAHDQAAATLNDPHWTRLFGDLERWIEQTLIAPTHPGANLDGLETAAAALDRRFRRVRRASPGVRTMSDLQRHRVRIETKKLRYGVGFFADLFAAPPAQTADFLLHAERVQTGLGHLQDLVVARRYAQAAAREAMATSTPDLLSAHRSDVEDAATALRALAAQPPCWPAATRPRQGRPRSRPDN